MHCSGRLSVDRFLTNVARYLVVMSNRLQIRKRYPFIKLHNSLRIPYGVQDNWNRPYHVADDFRSGSCRLMQCNLTKPEFRNLVRAENGERASHVGFTGAVRFDLHDSHRNRLYGPTVVPPLSGLRNRQFQHTRSSVPTFKNAFDC